MFTVYNNIECKDIFHGDKTQFVEFVTKIAIENEDNNFTIFTVNDAKVYIEKYCSNLNYTTQKEIKLPIGGIVVTIDYDDENRPVSGDITDTELTTENRDEEDELYNMGMDTILSMVLAHAMAEVDITSAGYIEGLETAINAVENNS